MNGNTIQTFTLIITLVLSASITSAQPKEINIFTSTSLSQAQETLRFRCEACKNLPASQNIAFTVDEATQSKTLPASRNECTSFPFPSGQEMMDWFGIVRPFVSEMMLKAELEQDPSLKQTYLKLASARKLPLDLEIENKDLLLDIERALVAMNGTGSILGIKDGWAYVLTNYHILMPSLPPERLREIQAEGFIAESKDSYLPLAMGKLQDKRFEGEYELVVLPSLNLTAEQPHQKFDLDQFLHQDWGIVRIKLNPSTPTHSISSVNLVTDEEEASKAQPHFLIGFPAEYRLYPGNATVLENLSAPSIMLVFPTEKSELTEPQSYPLVIGLNARGSSGSPLISNQGFVLAIHSGIAVNTSSGAKVREQQPPPYRELNTPIFLIEKQLQRMGLSLKDFQSFKAPK